MPTDYLVISTSLNPESKSRVLAQAAYEQFKKHGQAELIDLKEHPLPMCDGDNAYSHESVPHLSSKIKDASAIILAIPVYNYSSSASVKNLIELTGRAWSEKIVGFLCAAGGKSSYMSVMGLANSLMLDFRCLINPRFVYADGSAFSGDRISDPEIQKRVEELAFSTAKLVGHISSHV